MNSLVQVLFLLSLLLFLWLGSHALAHARVPPFEPAIVLNRPPQVTLEEVQFARGTDQGTLHVQARYMQPGHQRILFFKLGPSTFFKLQDIVASCRTTAGVLWRAQADAGRLGQRSISLAGRVQVHRGKQGPTLHRDMEIDLSTGRLRSQGH